MGWSKASMGPPSWPWEYMAQRRKLSLFSPKRRRQRGDVLLSVATWSEHTEKTKPSSCAGNIWGSFSLSYTTNLTAFRKGLLQREGKEVSYAFEENFLKHCNSGSWCDQIHWIWAQKKKWWFFFSESNLSVRIKDCFEYSTLLCMAALLNILWVKPDVKQKRNRRQ